MKTVRRKYALLFSVLILSLAGFIACNSNKNDQPGLTQQDQTFAAKASASNSSELQFGQLAVQRSKNDSVLAFAQMMISDHTAAQKSLDSITKSLNIVSSDTMDSAHKTLYNALSGLNSYSFDSAYILNQINDHRVAQPLYQDQVGMGKNAQLIKYANKYLPIVTRHLKRATDLQGYLIQSHVP